MIKLRKIRINMIDLKAVTEKVQKKLDLQTKTDLHHATDTSGHSQISRDWVCILYLHS